jgi:hypothetical protein
MTKLFLLLALFYLPAHAEVTICDGDFALCAAATCTPTGNTITNNAGETYPEVECKCPILHGKNIADPAIGNMQGSCSPTDSDHVWSTFWPRLEYPQESNHFSHEPRAMRVVVQNVRRNSNRDTTHLTASVGTARKAPTVSLRVSARWVKCLRRQNSL